MSNLQRHKNFAVLLSLLLTIAIIVPIVPIASARAMGNENEIVFIMEYADTEIVNSEIEYVDASGSYFNMERAVAPIDNSVYDLLNNYFVDRFYVLQNLSLDLSFIDKYYDSLNEKNAIEYQKTLLATQVEFYKAQLADLRFTDLEFQVKEIKVIGIEGSDMLLLVNVPYKFKYLSAEEYTVAPEDFHVLVISRTSDGTHKILAHNPAMDSFSFGFNETLKANNYDRVKTKSETITVGKMNAEETKRNAKQGIGEEVVVPDIEKNSFDSELENLLRATYSLKTYSSTSAKTYAEEWATSNNSAYGSAMSLDCTNFASQCLVAGGIPKDDTSGVTDKQFFWNSRNDNSYSWKNANGLYIYLTTNGGSTSNYGIKNVTVSTSAIISSVTTGDIISYFSGGYNSGASHSAVVTGSVTSGGVIIDRYLCQHSLSPYKNALLSTNNGTSPKKGLHINGYYK